MSRTESHYLRRRKCWGCKVVKNCVEVDDNVFYCRLCLVKERERQEGIRWKYGRMSRAPKVGRATQEPREKP